MSAKLAVRVIEKEENVNHEKPGFLQRVRNAWRGWKLRKLVKHQVWITVLTLVVFGAVLGFGGSFEAAFIGYPNNSEWEPIRRR